MILPGLYENRQDAVDQVKTDVQQYTGDTSPFLPKSFVGALCAGMGGVAFDISFWLTKLIQQAFVQTATGEALQNAANLVNVQQLQPNVAAGISIATGIVGTVIPINTQLTNNSGSIYITQSNTTISSNSISINSLNLNGQIVTAVTNEDNTLASGQTLEIAGANQTEYNGTFIITVLTENTFTYQISGFPVSPATGTITGSFDGAYLSLFSQATGSINNINNGSILSFSPTIDDVEPNSYVSNTDIKGGTDLESIEDWRRRIIYRYQNPHALFNVAQIYSVVAAVAGITRIWVFPTTPDTGFVSVYFTRDNDVDSILPSPPQVLEVRNAIDVIRPASVFNFQLIVSAPTPVNVDFIFQSITPNTPEMKQALISTLNFLFRDNQINVSQNVLAITYNAAIVNTIDSRGERLIDFSLSSPLGDILIADGELAVLNSITFIS